MVGQAGFMELMKFDYGKWITSAGALPALK
jgi:hypothetical protein